MAEAVLALAPSLVEARRVAAEIVRASGSSFAPAMRALPPAKRDAIYAVYAYCRVVDDIADGDDPTTIKLAKLDVWERRLDDLGQDGDPVAVALAEAVQRFDLPMAELRAVLDGMRRDCVAPVVAPSFDELRLYCRQVAGAVGVLCCAIFGDRSAAATAFAESRGEALQLTNILRDLDEDAERERLYLPREALERAGVASRVPADVLAHPALGAACEVVMAAARDRFAETRRLWRDCDARALRPALLMWIVYERRLQMLARRGWGDRRPMRTPKVAALLSFARAWAFGP